MVADNNASVFLALSVSSCSSKFWDLPYHLVNAVNTPTSLLSILTVYQNISHSYHDAYLDFSGISASPLSTTGRKYHRRAARRCSCSTYKLHHYSTCSSLRARDRIFCQFDDLQCFHISSNDSETASRDDSARHGEISFPSAMKALLTLRSSSQLVQVASQLPESCI